MTHRKTKAVLLGLTALTAAPAVAQDGPVRSGSEAQNPRSDAQALAPETSPSGVEDIVVTARKAEERLQEVPVAITAFSAADIKSARIENLNDLSKLTPGLNFTPLFGRQNQLPIIRGAAQTFGQLNVGVFLDGVYLSGKAAVDLELNDLERIEVVKGPQSALYGRNTFAGAINYITKRPTADLSGRVEGTIGDNGLKKGIASISGPLAEGVRFRVGAFYRDFDGFYDSAIDGGDVDFAESFGFTGTLEFTPSDTLTVTLRGTYSQDDLGQPPSNVIRNNSALGQPSGSTASPPAPLPTRRNLLYIGKLPSIPKNGVTVNTILSPIGTPFLISSYGDREASARGSLTVEKDFGAATLTSISSYFKRRFDYTFDGDNTVCQLTTGCPNFGYPFAPVIAPGTSVFALSSSRGQFRDISQELRLASSGDGPLKWLAGFFYYDNKTRSLDRSIAPVTQATANTFGFPRQRSSTKSYAGFASLGYELTEQLKVTGELRYEYEKQRVSQNPANPAVTPVPLGPGASGSAVFFTLKQNFDFWTPRVIVDYQVDPDKLVYASYARGAKTGGFNTNLNISADQRQYDPEYSNNFELGIKSDWLDRRLRINLAGYHIDWNDQQAACQNPVSAGGSSTQRTYTCNVAASTIYGTELEVAARFSEVFSIAGSYTWTHARYDRFVDDSLAATLILAGLPAIDFDGKHLPYVPDHKVVVSPRLNLPLAGDFSLEARADLLYQSRSYLRADNLQNFGSKTTVDLRLTARSETISLQLFANNVFDNKRPVAGVRFFDSVNYSVASPLVQGADRRQIGATLGYSF